MSSKRVALADTVFPDLEPAKQALAKADASLEVADEPTPEKILAIAKDADGLLVTYGKITAEVIDGLENCQVIGRFGIGIDNIDIPAATAKGIIVTYAPVYCLDEVSDHAMALMLTLARKTAFSTGRVHGGEWKMPSVVPIHRLRGQTVGLVGLGNIPQQVAPKAQAFGMEVIAADPYASDEVFSRTGVRKVELDELLAEADFVSVHAPLTPETTKMFSTDAFKKMKSSAYLVNTARGPLVDDVALAAALDAGEIAGAALDVLPVEPPAQDNPLIGRDNVILTPHTGFYSEESLLDLQTTVASDVAAVLMGEAPKFPINAKELGR